MDIYKVEKSIIHIISTFFIILIVKIIIFQFYHHCHHNLIVITIRVISFAITKIVKLQ